MYRRIAAMASSCTAAAPRYRFLKSPTPQASPKGLRHGFGVQAVSRGIPLVMVRKWLGHAQLSTTAIYADAVGEEEHRIAAEMWE